MSKSSQKFPELFLSTADISSRVSRAMKRGDLRKLGPSSIRRIWLKIRIG